jgi:DHA3 family macrolide efflux protein-like MFS transporter
MEGSDVQTLPVVPADPAPLATRLMNRNFLLLWQGQMISQLGNQAFSIGMAFWTLNVTGSASIMGLLIATLNLPTALLAPLGGAFADRFPRIRILVVCDLISGSAMMLQALAMMSGWFSPHALVGMLFGVALVLGMVNGFFLPTLSATIPDLVPEDKLTPANSLNQFSVQASALLGQALGGKLFLLLGASRLFLFDGISFLFASASEALVRVPVKPRDGERLGFAASARSYASNIREGMHYVWTTPGLPAYIGAPASYNFFAMAVFVLLPFYVRINLQRGADWYGYLLAMISVGMIVGFLLASLARFTGEARMRFMVLLIAAAPTPMLIVGFLHDRILALVIAFGLGICIGLINVNLITLVQHSTPPELRGRVLGLWSSLAGGLAPLGVILGGIAGDLTHKNIRLVYATCGILAFAISAFCVALPSTRRFLARA